MPSDLRSARNSTWLLGGAVQRWAALALVEEAAMRGRGDRSPVHRTSHRARRSRTAVASALAVVAATLVSLAGQSQVAAPAAAAPATCGDPGCIVTVDAKDLN